MAFASMSLSSIIPILELYSLLALACPNPREKLLPTKPALLTANSNLGRAFGPQTRLASWVRLVHWSVATGSPRTHGDFSQPP